MGGSIYSFDNGPLMTYLQVYKIVTSNKVVSKIVSTGIVFNNSIKENLGIYKSNKVGGF
jgi:hypothetical protein